MSFARRESIQFPFRLLSTFSSLLSRQRRGCSSLNPSKASFRTVGTSNRKIVPMAIEAMAAVYRSRYPLVRSNNEFAEFRVTLTNQMRCRDWVKKEEGPTTVKVRALGQVPRRNQWIPVSTGFAQFIGSVPLLRGNRFLQSRVRRSAMLRTSMGN